MLLMLCFIHLDAQEKWTQQDSVWLQRILSGEEKLQLNEETLKAIRSGTLVSPGYAGETPLLSSDRELPFLKSFDDIAPEEDSEVSPFDLPPSVYLRYGIRIKDSVMPVSCSMMLSDKNVAELKRIAASTPRLSTVDDPSTIRSGVSAGFSFEDILCPIFQPSYRAKKTKREICHCV
jgi:hypothetical protein